VRTLPYAVVLVVPVLAFAHCNSIVGVQDVHLSKSSSDAGKSKSSGDDDDETQGPPSQPPPAEQPTTTPPPPASGCNGVAGCTRIAFVTRAVYTGNLGGLSGGDQKCNDAAKAVPALAGHTFRAWLSQPDSAATSRLPHGTSPYQRTDKGVVATTFSDLTDGSVTMPILLDETGTALPSDADSTSVWTSTNPDGTSDPDFHCQNWTSEDILDSGVCGDASATDSTWTTSLTISCNAQRHLYCLEF
jgi:hypothetical protein